MKSWKRISKELSPSVKFLKSKLDKYLQRIYLSVNFGLDDVSSGITFLRIPFDMYLIS